MVSCRLGEGDPNELNMDSDSSDVSLTDSEDGESEHEEIEQGEMNSDESSDGISSGEQASGDEEEEEDPLISTITSRQEVIATKPPPIKGDDLFTDLSFHPDTNLIALSTLSGNVELYSFSIEENVQKGTIEAHTKACRAVEFSTDGKTLYTIGRDKNIIFSDVETLDMKMFIDGAHHEALTALCVPGEHLLASGDEEGVIKIWDTRHTQTAVFKAHDSHDYISCITSKSNLKIACTSGDGILVSYDIRMPKKLQESAPYETDLTCCTSTHNESMLVCGSMAGQFLFYKWNDYSDIAGTFKPNLVKKSPINAVLPISDNIVVAGMEDGCIRAYHFFPHKEIGVVGQHNLNIERLDVSAEGSLIASLSPDPIVKFWDISYLEGFVVTDVEKAKVKGGKNLPSSEFDDRKSFFSDLG